MNRSMVKRAKRLSVQGFRNQFGGEFGTVDFVAVFPRKSFGADGPAYTAGETFLPVSYGLWWTPANLEAPGGSGTAVVALEGWEKSDGAEAMPNRVYVRRIEDSLEYPGEGDYPDIFDLYDKPHKVRYVKGADVFEEPEIYADINRPFDEFLEREGYLPDFTSSIYGWYSGRWFLNLQYAPYQYYPGMDPEDVLWRTVRFMDWLRKERGAQIRLYGTHGDRESNSPVRRADDADFFLRSLEAFYKGDRESWLFWGNWPAK